MTGPRDMAGAGGIWQRERDMAARTALGGAGLAGEIGRDMAGADGIYSFRLFGAPLPYIGLPQRFCEAKDLWEEGEQVFSWQRHGVALTTCELGNGTWSVPFPDRARFLPRETSEHRSKAASKTSGLRNLLRCDEEARGGGKPRQQLPPSRCARHLPRRGRQEDDKGKKQ